MTVATLLQILGACTGVIGSLFFAIGVMRQSIDAMARLAGTYFDYNPHMIPALAAQKADYLFGGGLIVVSFSLNLLSFMFSNTQAELPPEIEANLPWLAVISTVLAFLALLACSRLVSSRYALQIRAHIADQQAEHARQSAERGKKREQQAHRGA